MYVPVISTCLYSGVGEGVLYPSFPLVCIQEWEKVYYAASTHLVKGEKEKKLDEAAELIEQVSWAPD